MTTKILVTNDQPIVTNLAPQHSLELFKTYGLRCHGQYFLPFEHQAKVFNDLEKGKEVLLVAGTASGKTLAIAVPLFVKLKRKIINRVLFMYPTVALLEDQLRVMNTLAELSGFEIGRIQGGMNRSELISALVKPVIVATPDAIYWFLRKNVKYSGLFIYGLCQVDEFILDEAHLFNGLMQQNFKHLWYRIKTLASCLGKKPKIHVLSATPTEDLKSLNGVEPIFGRSKCGNVLVEFKASGRFDRADRIVNAVNQALDAGHRKILVVSNSARLAHQLFEKYKVNDSSLIPVEHRLKFGNVTLSALNNWFNKAGVGKELVDKINNRLNHEEDVVLADIPKGIIHNVSLQDVVMYATEVLEGQCWHIKRALWEQNQRSIESLHSLLKNRPLPCKILEKIKDQLETAADIEKKQSIVDVWLANTIERLCYSADDPVACEGSSFDGLTRTFVVSGMDRDLAMLLVNRLVYQIPVGQTALPTRNFSDRPVNLRYLEYLLDKEDLPAARKVIKSGIESGNLAVECRHIGLWKGTDVPVIVYSGSMSKNARAGLISVFSDMERAVLISTEAVEVGVDFQADTLITEQCDSNAFLQRFGRVGRQGNDSKVIVLVSGNVYAQAREMDAMMSREFFSANIRRFFPHRNYAATSELLDASHYLINSQLGRIGKRLNNSSYLNKLKPMADKLRSAGVQLGFGLRSTMPQITLLDGVTKDPFYLLRYVDDQTLHAADSPFEVGRAKTWFTNLIFKRAAFDVIVDLEETLKASRYLFTMSHDEFNPPLSQPGVGAVYLDKMAKYFDKTRGWNKWHLGNFMLLHGDIYLKWVDRQLQNFQSVRDIEQNPLYIPSQTYLVLWGWTEAGETREFLEKANIDGWEEMYYDWDRLKYEVAMAMVIIETMTGACFAAYKELVSYVNRKIQK